MDIDLFKISQEDDILEKIHSQMPKAYSEFLDEEYDNLEIYSGEIHMPYASMSLLEIICMSDKVQRDRKYRVFVRDKYIGEIEL